MIRLVISVVLLSVSLFGATVRFDPRSPEIGPFPTDYLTVRDRAQKTGLRVNLPLPDCKAEPSTCMEIGLINQLDGFSLDPRIRVRFSAPVDLTTLRNGVFLIWLDRLADDDLIRAAGEATPINQLQYDPATNSLFAKPDETLAQTRRYALVVTDAVKDTAGRPVEADAGFKACLEGKVGGRYCDQLGVAMAAVAAAVAPARVVGGSVFTTLSATTWMEQARAALENAALGLVVAKNVAVADLASLVVKMHVGTNPAKFQDAPVSLAALSGVGRIAFGSYISPNFLDPMIGMAIPPTPTALDVNLPPAAAAIHFHIFLPQTPPPATGYPVVLVGSATILGERFTVSSAVAGTLTARGFAVAAINPAAYGGGPEGRIALTDKTGNTSELPYGGRSVDLNQDGAIGSSEGSIAASGFRDFLRQTAVDWLQFVRVIRAGVDLNSDGVVDLDRDQVSLLGICLGADYGALVQAVEPGVRAAVLASPYDSIWAATGWIQSFARPWMVMLLAMRKPSLVNKPGPDFESLPVLRGAPARLIDVPGALEIQEYLERMEWIDMPGWAIAFARRLAGKRALFQMGWGDLVVPNCNLSVVIRAAGAREMTSVYRHDLARAVVPELSPDFPHLLLIPSPSGPPAGLAITMAAQQQVAQFLASDGRAVPDVNALVRPLFGKDLFVIPDTLPDGLNR